MDEKTKEIIELFEQISKVPRCSGNEDLVAGRIRELVAGFETGKDKVGNMVVRVPGSKGLEKAPTIVLQAHLDMVCEKKPDSSHDFSKDPIKFLHNGDWITADGTTLGADNGVGVALALKAALDEGLARPPLELLFTVDEESGLTGALGLETGLITGNTLINLDSGDEGLFIVGCAGGKGLEMELPAGRSQTPGNWKTASIRVSGLKGGHSGVDIHKNRANANVLLARLLSLAVESANAGISQISGGTAHNVIPREAEAKITCDPGRFAELKKVLSDFEKTVRNEYAPVDDSISFTIEEDIAVKEQFSPEDTKKIVRFLSALPHSVAQMSLVMEGVVETSNNLAVVESRNDDLIVLFSQRSLIESKLEAAFRSVGAIAALAGAKTNVVSAYPGWVPNPDSELLNRCKKTYEGTFGKKPRVSAIHAGLECGVIGSKYENMDMISLGPTIENLHSPAERLNVPSVGKIWLLLENLLKSYTLA